MNHNNFYTYDTGTPSSSILDWVEALGSLGGSNPLTGLEDAPATVSRFDQDVDEALGPMYPAMAPLDFVCGPGSVDDWQYISNTAMPYPTPVLTDDTSTTAYSASQAPSPASGTTFVDSPFAFSANVELARAGDALVDQPVAFPPSAFHDFDFTFQCEPTLTMPPFDPSSLLQQPYYDNSFAYNQGQYWPGQQSSQHEVGAAGAVVSGLVSGVEVNADAFAFTSMDPTSLPLLPVPLPEPQQEPVVVEEPQPITTVVKKRSRLDSDVEPHSPAGESDNEDATPPKKKRKQSKAKRFPCPFPDCDSTHSRTHNLKVHIDSVHLGKRSYVCDEPGCLRAFSRKHDLIRHHQSAHTDLGSPRNAQASKGAKGWKVVKKDEYDA